MLAMLIFALIVTMLTISVHWYLKNKNRMNHWKKLPCRQSSFWFADVRHFIKTNTRKKNYDGGVYFLESILRQNDMHQREGLSAFWLGPTPLVNVFCPELAKKVMGSSGSLDRSFEYDFFKKGFGPGLFFRTGSEWRSRRRLLNPCFNFQILEDFLPVFDEQSRILVSQIEQIRGEEHIDVMPLVTLCTIDIVSETLMGVRIGAQRQHNLEYTTAVNNLLGDILNQRVIAPWLRPDFLFNLSQIGREFDRKMRIVHNFTRNVIASRKEAVLSKRREQEQASPGVVKEEDGRRRRQTLLDLLLDHFFEGGQLTEQDIMDEVNVFMFAGQDTTVSGVVFALYCVGRYPDVQGRLHEELDFLFQGDEVRAVTMDDVRGMKYLDCVLKETQRLYPSSPFIGRRTATDIEHKGFVIPSGTDVYVNALSLHRQPDSFPDPEVFDPDRFLLEHVLKRHPYAYAPFAAGPRNCIGQKFAILEMKVVVANILRRFRIVSLDPQVRFKLEINLKPAQPIRLQFQPRTPSSENLLQEHVQNLHSKEKSICILQQKVLAPRLPITQLL